MRKQTKQILVCCVLGFLSFVFAIGTTLFTESAKAEFIAQANLQDSYSIGQTIEIPTAVYKIGDTEHKAYSVVYTPNGVGYKTNKISLESGGKYTVVYMAEVDGKLYQESKEFVVKQQKYYATGDKSEITGGSATNSLGQEKTGVKVSLARGEKFVISEVLSLRENITYQDPLIDLTLLPTVQGKSDAKKLYVLIEDAFDSSNFIEYRVKLNDGNQQWTYSDARTPNQSWLGLQYYMNPDDPMEAYPHYNAAAGSVAGMNGGAWYNGKGYSSQVYLCYNPDENALYANSSIPTTIFGTKYFPSNPWAGFSSDYVKVSVYADEYIAETCNFIVTKVGDKSLSVEEFNDNEGPEIVIEKGDLDLVNMPVAVVGQKYSLPSATAEDVYSGNNLRVSTRVFFKYARENGDYATISNDFHYEINVFNGEFIPTKAGKYSIVYSSKDYYGNYSEKVVTVNTVNPTEYQSELFANFSEGEKVAEVNNLVDVAKIEEVGGQKGNLTIEYSVTLDGEEIKLSGNLSDGYTFVPTEVGNYNVEIVVKDTNGDTITNNYVIEVSANTKNAYSSDATLPKYFIAGESYYIPQLLAIDKATGKEVDSTITYVDGAGERTYSGVPVSFIPDENGNVKVKYSSNGNEKVYEVPVISVKGLYGLAIEEYFQGENVTKSVDASGVKLDSFKKDSKATFIKQVGANAFLLRMKVDKTKNEFEKINVWLEDSQNKSQKILLTVNKSKNDSLVLINGKASQSFVSDVFFNDGYFNLEFSAKTNSISTGIGESTVVEEYYSGEKFVGFESGNVYLTIETVGVTGQGSIWVSQINTQKISINTTSDTIKPELIIGGVYDDIIVSPGNAVTVYSAHVVDVLSEIAASYVSVTKDGNYVVANGRLMKNLSLDRDYEFTVTEVGTYVITYYVIDTAGKNNSYTCQISVENFNLPTITVNKRELTVKVGETLTIPVATAKDYFGNDCKVFVYLIRPDYSSRSLTGIDKIILNEVGTYRLRYLTTDADGNSAYAEVIVNVVEG